MSPTRSSWWRWIAFVAGAAAFALALRGARLGEVVDLLAARGPLVLLALLPYLAQLGLDALAWRVLLGALDHPVSWRRLFAIRLASEAVLMTVPAGALAGEAVKPYLLAKSHVPVADAVATIAIKKCLLILADALYLTTALVLGRTLLGRVHLFWPAVGAVVVLLAVAAGMSLALGGGRAAETLHRALLRLPGARLRLWLDARRAHFADADAQFTRLGRARARRALALALLFGAWLVEACEAYLVLRLLGVSLPFGDAIAMEACVVFVRNLAFFVPAGLGVQDAGYLAFLRALRAGVAAPAFVLVKRAKELVWIAIGYLTLLLLDGPSPAAPPAEIGTR